MYSRMMNVGTDIAAYMYGRFLRILRLSSSNSSLRRGSTVAPSSTYLYESLRYR